MRNLLYSVSCSSLLLAIAATFPANAQDKPPAVEPAAGTTLPPVQVEAPAQRPARQQVATSSRSSRAVRAGTRPRTSAAQPSTSAQQVTRATPLNSNVVTQAGSRLGLTPRETPAAVEVVGADTIREQGYHTTIDVVKGATGVTAGDAPNDVAFAMRGFQGNQINVTYNGINVGPTGFTFLTAETFNLDRVEFLKGPSSLMTGQGAVGGSINYVTKAPHNGPIQSEAFFGFDSRGSYRTGFGSGGNTNIKGLDYRFDISRSDVNGFIDDTDTKNLHVSGQLDYRLSESFKVFGAVEFKDYRARVYEGTPLVPIAFSGRYATSGIVSGTKVSDYNGANLGPVTIDSRTLSTNYNVLDNHKTIKETWGRAGFEWNLSNDVTLRSQTYEYNASRDWHNNEVSAFDTGNNQIYRERFFVHHNQNTVGNNTDVTWDARFFGMENRLVLGAEAYHLEFTRPAAANFPNDFVNLVDPVRGYYGLLTTQRQTATIDSVAFNLENRLKLTPTFALIGGLRYNPFSLDRSSTDVFGASKAGFPYSANWDPVTGRIGYTWEALPGLIFYSQYATASDLSAGSMFMLNPTQKLTLTDARSYETGVKNLLWDGRAEWTFSAFDIVRNNVYSAQAGQTLNIAGKLKTQGVEFAAAVRPLPELKIWGNVAYVHARYADYDFAGGSFSGKTPPNIPALIVNGGASYRFLNPGWLPVEAGISVRHVGDRYTTDANTLTMLAYTTADAFAFVDIPKSARYPTFENTRVTFRVRNLTDKKYAVWSDPFYPDQIFLGARRTYEIETSFKF
ncbi:TonB-dependent receptor [Bradyrhizobium sp. CCGE-LA001]|uniref:TonB-dependent receptor n=1 Tax=Bradyrhizobium sp. CCGE-LA001 TaxID=1223566 RepID=UPI000745B755|nr:TonB-dependent receptor [Bradyrhizobium sp. CCGE-LA001]AMA58961.1 ligand-gated channel protein [Bradyrhizobium sp. CCGE-LA001]